MAIRRTHALCHSSVSAIIFSYCIIYNDTRVVGYHEHAPHVGHKQARGHAIPISSSIRVRCTARFQDVSQVDVHPEMSGREHSAVAHFQESRPSADCEQDDGCPREALHSQVSVLGTYCITLNGGSHPKPSPLRAKKLRM